MAMQTAHKGQSGSELSETIGASFNASLEGTQQRRRHQAVHREAANVATENMTQDAHLKIVWITGRGTHKKQHAIGCGYFHLSWYMAEN